MKRLLFILVPALLLTVASSGQILETLAISTSDRGASGAVKTRTFVPVIAVHAPVVIDRPFSAIQTSEIIQTLPDGTQLKPTVPVRRLYRDSQGRTRIEWQVSTDRDAPTVVELNDPLGGKYFLLETNRKIAYRSVYAPLPRQKELVPALGPEPAPPKGAVQQTEPLGKRMLSGLETSGVRTTTTFPVGTINNKRPIVRTRDVWVSPELSMWVLLQYTDPLLGDNVTRLTEISLQQPEASLFEVPRDYIVSDETTSYVIEHGSEPGALRPGNGVSLPVPIKSPEPKYTREAANAGIQGSVRLQVIVNEKGEPEDIFVTRSLDAGLDQNAVKALKQWRFQPGMKDGKPVKVNATIEISFRLLK